jgi:hypothetical protein
MITINAITRFYLVTYGVSKLMTTDRDQAVNFFWSQKGDSDSIEIESYDIVDATNDGNFYEYHLYAMARVSREQLIEDIQDNESKPLEFYLDHNFYKNQQPLRVSHDDPFIGEPKNHHEIVIEIVIDILKDIDNGLPNRGRRLHPPSI